MGMIYSCYVPTVVNNPYALNVRRLLNNQGIETYPIKECLTDPRKFAKCKIFNFNWFEKVTSKKEYFLKCALLEILHIVGKKIIYTVHNKQPHNSEKDTLSIKMMGKLCDKADAILGLCPDTESVIRNLSEKNLHKLRFVHHPNYISNYDLNTIDNYRSRYDFDSKDMVFLFLGFISPYKNVELLIKIFNEIKNPHVKLLIAGNPCSQEYKEELLSLITNTAGIYCDFRYIPDEEIVNYYNTSDIVVMPYHKTSSLNSGAVYLSFSLKKTVICPDIGTINALEDKSFVYDYDYDNEDEHLIHLKKKVFEACSDFECDKTKIVNKGKKAFEYVSTVLSDDRIANEYLEIYRGLVEV